VKTDKNQLLLLLFCCFCLPFVQGKTYISDPIAENTRWNLMGSPYIIANDIKIMAGATLNIEAGVEVLFSRNVQIIVEGAVVARGTWSLPIEISGLDKKQWEGFFFRKNYTVLGQGATDTTSNIFEHCIFRGRMYTPTYLLRSEGRTLRLKNCKIYDCQTAVQAERQAHIYLSYCKIERCYRPLHVRVTSQVWVEHCKIKDFALLLISGSLQFGYNRVEKSLSRGKHTGFVLWQVGAAVVDIYENHFLRASQAAFTLYKTSRRSTITLRRNRFSKNGVNLSLSCEQLTRGTFTVSHNFFHKPQKEQIQLFDNCNLSADTIRLDSNYFQQLNLATFQSPENISYPTPDSNANSHRLHLECAGLLPASTRRRWGKFSWP
jgi:hypothetical protein